jgi:hypothetical protein
MKNAPASRNMFLAIYKGVLEMLHTADHQYLSWLKPAKLCVELKIWLLIFGEVDPRTKRTLRQETIGNMNGYTYA